MQSGVRSHRRRLFLITRSRLVQRAGRASAAARDGGEGDGDGGVGGGEPEAVSSQRGVRLPLALSGGGRDDDAMRGLRAGGEPVAVSGVRTVPLRAQAVGGGCAAGQRPRAGALPADGPRAGGEGGVTAGGERGGVR